MAISQKLLNEGEHVVFSTRTHVKALFMPMVVLIVVAGLAGYLSSLPNGDAAAIWRWVIWAVAGTAGAVRSWWLRSCSGWWRPTPSPAAG